MSTLNEHDIDRIQDYIDGELPDDAMREVADRLNRDPEWRAEEERLRALLRRVHGLPKTVDPGRDLWHGIERRIAEAPAENVVTVNRWALYAYAAAAGLVVVASVTFAVMNGREPAMPNTAEGPQPKSIEPPPGGELPVVFASNEEDDPDDVEHELALAHYKSATGALRESIEERRDSLEEETWTAVSESLLVIDRAIREIEAALRDDPSNQELRTMLVAAYQKEVGLLRQAVLL